MGQYLHDLRLSLRMLRRSPGLSIMAIAALAMGIGFTTTMYSIVHGALRDLPFDRPEQLVAVTLTSPRLGRTAIDPRPFDYSELRGSAQSLSGLAGYTTQGVNLSGDDSRPERRTAARLTPNAFAVLRQGPLLGRLFTDDDAAPGRSATVVLSHDLWRARFQADSGILGRDVRVDGQPTTVIGVMPPWFGFPLNADLWLPLAVDRSAAPGTGDRFLMLGRLADGATLKSATAELVTIVQRVAHENPATHAGYSARAFPFVETELGDEVPVFLFLLMGAVSLVLLIACANVANLLLARAATRTRDIAIRTALGATRARMVVQQLTESVILALIGGALGLGMAVLGVRFFARSTADVIEAFWMQFRVDGAVVTYATAAAIFAAVVAGIIPAWRATRADVSDVLKDQTSASTGLRMGRLARALVTVEVALATGFLITTVTFVKSAVGLRTIDLSFPTRTVYSGQLGVLNEVLNNPGEREGLFTELTRRLKAIPGVTHAALASVLPGRGSGNWSFALDDRTYDRLQDMPITGVTVVAPEYFDLLEGHVVRGRAITAADRAGAPDVAVVNEEFVRRHSADRDPLGRRFMLGERSFTIVGIVDLKTQDIDSRTGDVVYTSIFQMRPFAVRLMARVAGDPVAIAPQVRAAVEAVDPDLPLFEEGTLHEAIYNDKQVLDTIATLFFGFGAGALFLTVVGLYGVVSFGVSRRTREIGVRVVLGATPGDVVRLVLRQALREWAIGTGVGLCIAVGLSYGLAYLDDVIQPASVVMYLAVVVLLTGGGLLGLLVPMRRALALEPGAALRGD